MIRINPFRPNHPVGPGMFAGRLDEVERMEQALLQTQAGNPVNFLITGERGIGKSSLLLYAKAIAETGDIYGHPAQFLVLDTDLDASVTQLGLIKKIELAIRHQLGQSERARTFLSDAWQFIQRVEAGGFALKHSATDILPESVVEEFSYSLAATVDRLCKPGADKDTFGARYDGVLLIIDEADNAVPQLQLGSFLKLLSERVQRRGCDRFAIGLAGLPEIRSLLKQSHASSVRLFDEIHLDRLTADDVRAAVGQAMDIASKQNGRPFQFTESGMMSLVSLAEGFPHFIQQFGYSAFEVDKDDNIDLDDVMKGGFKPNGALELIGNRYYRDDFYEKIKKDSYRQVLRIMAEHWDQWVAKDDIRARFRGDANTLDNAIYALRKRHIIVSQEGSRGIYRLQNKGFAWWIKVHATPPAELVVESEGDSGEDEGGDEE